MRVQGSGPLPCSIAIVGEGPGAEEEKSGLAFVGKSGKILWQFLQRYAGITRDRCYVTNVIKDRLVDEHGENREPTEAEFTAALPELYAELAICNPIGILAVGAWATRALAHDGMKADLYTLHGTLQYRKREDGFVFPCYHPAAGMRVPTLLSMTAYDIEQFGKWMKSGWVVGAMKPVVRENYYRLDCMRFSEPWFVGADTEGYTNDPWSAQFSVSPGDGGIVLAEERRLFQIAENLRTDKPTILLHASLHDLPVLRAMSMDLIRDEIPFIDTMVMAYLLQIEPLSLKSLARRHCDMYMTEYSDLIAPYLDQARRDFLEEASGITTHPIALKRLKAVSKDLSKGKPVNLERRWENWPLEVKVAIESAASKKWPTPRLPGMVPDKVWHDYACRDADATRRVYVKLLPKIKEQKLEEVLEMDMSVIPMIDRMQQVGMLVDRGMVMELDAYLSNLLSNIWYDICLSTGDWDFNPGSGDEVAEFLYGDQGIIPPRLTKSRKRGSTEAKILKAIQDRHPVVPLIMKYREAEKLLGTFVRPLLGFVRKDGRIHPNFSVTRAVTGRLTCEDPNLLAFPVRTELGRRVRKCFTAGEGRVLVSVDLSQIELRLAADESKDPVMTQAFQNKEDMHQQTADRLKVKRNPTAKTVNFGILYGIEGKGLHVRLVAEGVTEYSEQDCTDLIRKWFETYAGVKRWMDERGDEARRFGCVRDRWGRMRYLPAVHLQGDVWPFGYLRGEALRQAGNFPIQAGAQGLEKRGMARVWRDSMLGLRDLSSDISPLLQIHDELILECPEEKAEEVGARVRELMLQDQDKFEVPLEAEWTMGKNWGELKE